MILLTGIRLAFALTGLAALGVAQTAALPRHAPLVLTSPVQDKNFFLLSLMQRDSEVLRALEADADLLRMARARKDAVARAAKDCPEDLACFHAPFRLTESEILTASTALGRVYQSSAALR